MSDRPGAAWAPAAVALALFAAVGVAQLDESDPPRGTEVTSSRHDARAAIDYVRGEGSLRPDYHRYYGVALEVPLLLVERALAASTAAPPVSAAPC